MRKKILKILKEKISLSFTAQCSYLPCFRINLPVWFFFFLFAGFFAFIFSFFKLSAVYADYILTKADNQIMKGKLIYIAARAKESLDYLEMSRKTENQIRKVIGVKEFEIKDSYFGGPEKEDIKTFRETLKEKAEKINADLITRAYDKIKNESKNRLSGYSEVAWYLANKNNLAKAMPKGWPAQGSITSPFGYRIHPITLSYEYHSGVDISAPPGDPIIASAEGIVRHAGWQQGYGLSVLIDHGFGYSTLYGHMSEIKVKEGDTLSRGDLIGKVGSTGTSTGPHLHYEVWEYGAPINPIKYMEHYKNVSLAKTFLFENIFGR